LLLVSSLCFRDALGKEIEVKTLNRGPQGNFFVFEPQVVRIELHMTWSLGSLNWDHLRGIAGSFRTGDPDTPTVRNLAVGPSATQSCAQKFA
jgi:hypothetical protein